MKIELFSYVGVFRDLSKMHPGFKIRDVLFVLTNSLPQETPFILIDAMQIESAHFKAKAEHVYLTAAYNQDAIKFNENSGGELCLTVAQLKALRAQYRLPEDLEKFFYHT